MITHTMINAGLRTGSPCCAGVARDDLGGFFYPPTVLGDVTPAVSVYREEVFGPVAAIITVADAEEAVAVANDTPFGLGASIWSADVQAAVAIGRRITSGACFINALVVSDARMPFGGTKRSGYGRNWPAPESASSSTSAPGGPSTNRKPKHPPPINPSPQPLPHPRYFSEFTMTDTRRT